MLSCFGCVQLCVTPWTVAHQAPLSRQKYWYGFPCPLPGDLPDPGIEPASLMSPAMPGRFFTTSATWEAPCRSILTDKDVCNILTKKKKKGSKSICVLCPSHCWNSARGATRGSGLWGAAARWSGCGSGRLWQRCELAWEPVGDTLEDVQGYWAGRNLGKKSRGLVTGRYKLSSQQGDYSSTWVEHPYTW